MIALATLLSVCGLGASASSAAGDRTSFYLIATPDVENATSTFVRVVNGRIESRTTLGQHTVYGSNERYIATLALTGGVQHLALWDKCTGGAVRAYDYPKDRRIVYLTTLRASIALDLLEMDPDARFIYITGVGLERGRNGFYQIDLSSGAVELTYPEKDVPKPPYLYLEVTPAGLLLKHPEGNMDLRGHRKKAFSPVPGQHLPFVTGTQFLPGVGLVYYKPEEDEHVERLTDVDLNVLPRPVPLTQGEVSSFRGGIRINGKPVLLYTKPAPGQAGSTEVLFVDVETQRLVWSKAFVGDDLRVGASPDGSRLLLVDYRAKRVIACDRLKDVAETIDLGALLPNTPVIVISAFCPVAATAPQP